MLRNCSFPKKPFPAKDFEKMTDKEARKFAKTYEFPFFYENYYPELDSHKFTGWRKEFKRNIATQIKADKGMDISFNPMYFLLIHDKQ